MATDENMKDGGTSFVKVTFTKEQILKSQKYKDRADLLGVLLQNGREYSLSEVDSLIDDFMKGKVN